MTAGDTTIRWGHRVTFGAIVLFSIIELCIAAWLAAQYAAHHNYPRVSVRDRVRFVLFCATWTVSFGSMMMILFLHSTTGPLASIGAHLLFLGLTWIMWTAGAAAITQALGGGLHCKTQDLFVYCTHLNALEGFAWLIWILVTFALIAVLIRGITRKGDGYGAGLVSA
jgi:hypothetical protein